MLFGLVGMLFGANKAFQTIPSLNWFKGNLKLKLIRIFIANILIVPSWFLVFYMPDILYYTSIGIVGIDVFLINSLHFFVLYYFLFGIIPAYIFKRFNLFALDLKIPQFIPQKMF